MTKLYAGVSSKRQSLGAVTDRRRVSCFKEANISESDILKVLKSNYLSVAYFGYTPPNLSKIRYQFTCMTSVV